MDIIGAYQLVGDVGVGTTGVYGALLIEQSATISVLRSGIFVTGSTPYALTCL